MRTIDGILAKIRAAGGSISLENGTVSVNIPSGLLDQEDRRVLAERREEIIGLLSGASVSETPHPLDRWLAEQDWSKWRREGDRWIGPDSNPLDDWDRLLDPSKVFRDFAGLARRLRQRSGLPPKEEGGGGSLSLEARPSGTAQPPRTFGREFLL